MRLKFFAAVVLLAVAALIWHIETPAAEEAKQACAPSDKFHYVCGLANPEDLIAIPGTSWLIASGHKKMAGLSAIDTKTGHVLHLATPAKPDLKTFPDCAAPTETLWAHGLYLRAIDKANYKLYVIGHEPEMVHVLDMKVGAKGPSLTWAGCLPIPRDANSVAALKDGTIFATVFTFPGTSMSDSEVGKETGAIFRWRPGEKGFVELLGTRLPGNNGIDFSFDEKTIYVVASGLRSVLAFTNADQPQKLWTAPLPIVKPDNMHREPSGTFLIAGMVDDEKACGGKRRLIKGVLEISDCHRGSVAVRMNAATKTFTVVKHVEPDANFTNAASAVVVGKTIWFGGFGGDRVAYAPLK